jgi:hypothetical protein
MLFRVTDPEEEGILLGGGILDLLGSPSGAADTGAVVSLDCVDDELVRRKNGMDDGVRRLPAIGGLDGATSDPTGVILVTDLFPP